MLSDNTRKKLIFFLIILGFLVSVVSFLENHVEWLSSLCGFFGSGCHETDGFTFLKIPVSLWGIIYYLLLFLTAFFSRRNLFIIVMAGAGFELTLVSAMFEMKLVCFFCIVNLGLMMLLFLITFDQSMVWQALALTFLCFLVSDHLLTHEMKKKPQSEKTPEISIVASVGGTTITKNELEGPLSAQIYKLNRQIFNVKKERLDQLVQERLIELDAYEKGLTPEVLTYRIMMDGTEVSDEEVEAYYSANTEDFKAWTGSVEELKKRIHKYLYDMKTTEKVDAYVKPLKRKYQVHTYLAAPPLPFTTIDEGNSPSSGPADAPVTVVEYSDYMCPACRKAHDVVEKIRSKYTGRVRWIFKNYLLDKHHDVSFMAQAAHCAGEQGRFWEFQDILFRSGKNVDISSIKKYGRILELDAGSFENCIDSGRYLPVIEKDKKEGRKSGVSSTPTFIINGQISPGYLSFEAFSELIEKELEKSIF